VREDHAVHIDPIEHLKKKAALVFEGILIPRRGRFTPRFPERKGKIVASFPP